MQSDIKIPEGYIQGPNQTFIPAEKVKDYEYLKDDVINSLFEKADEIRGNLSAFKIEAIDEVHALMRCLAEEYNVKSSSQKGNIVVTSIDGNKKVSIAIHDFLTFDENLLVAKDLIDEYLIELVKDSNADIKQLVVNAFEVDKKGNLSLAKILPLLKYDIGNAKWQEAMKAIKRSISVSSSKAYVRFHKRDENTNEWVNLPLDIAKV